MYGFIIVCVFISFDIVTGILNAWNKGKISSNCLRKGMLHKFTELVVVFGAWLFDYMVGEVYVKTGTNFYIGVSFYICTMELVSIIENVCEIEPRLYHFFKPYLEKLKETDEHDKRN